MSETTKKQSLQVDEIHVEPDQLAIGSEKKLRANRENAKKSTGPRTERGKAHSRQNAIKHGLFAMPSIASLLPREDQEEYDKLLTDLWEQYKPSGRAEELEVERIAQSWWRLMRAHRFENAVRRVAISDVAHKELAYQHKWSNELDEKDQDFIQQLQKLSDEIDSTGEVPTDLNERLIAVSPGLKFLWPLIEAEAEHYLTQSSMSNLVEEFGPEHRPVAVALLTIVIAIRLMQELGRMRRSNITEIAYDQHAIPNSDALDRMLRYEAAIDRNLNRALDRLSQMQRRRKGEPVLPPVSVRLTRGS